MGHHFAAVFSTLKLNPGERHFLISSFMPTTFYLPVMNIALNFSLRLGRCHFLFGCDPGTKKDAGSAVWRS